MEPKSELLGTSLKANKRKKEFDTRYSQLLRKERLAKLENLEKS
jgi:hypothetical protein